MGLKVKMLGTFELEYEGKPISIERNSSTKVNQLLQMLLYNREGIRREMLMQYLFSDENVADPSNSLRALVFRLRKALKAQGLPDDDYVKISRGTYRWSPIISAELDVHEFLKTVEEARFAYDAVKQEALYRKAVDMYAGEFLPMLRTVDWALAINTKCKKEFEFAADALCQIYLKDKEYGQLLTVSQKATGLYPLGEWQTYMMEALIGLNRKKEALHLYEETETMMFEELGVHVSESMAKKMESLGLQVRNNTDVISNVQSMLENTKEDQDGAFFCSYPSFLESYRFMKRVIGRTGQSAWLMLCTITDGKGYALDEGDRLDSLAAELEESIQVSVRSGDMYTRYSNNQYLIFLLGITQEDCSTVEDRINANMSKDSRKKYIQYHIAPVSSHTSIEDAAAAANSELSWRK